MIKIIVILINNLLNNFMNEDLIIVIIITIAIKVKYVKEVVIISINFVIISAIKDGQEEDLKHYEVVEKRRDVVVKEDFTQEFIHGVVITIKEDAITIMEDVIAQVTLLPVMVKNLGDEQEAISDDATIINIDDLREEEQGGVIIITTFNEAIGHEDGVDH